MTGWAGNIAIAVAGLIVGALGGRLGARRNQPSSRAAEPGPATPGSGSDTQEAERAAQLRQLRHDLRGALSPALLAADRLLTRNDETVRHSAEIVIRALERATALIDAARDPLPETRPHAQTGGDTAKGRRPA